MASFAGTSFEKTQVQSAINLPLIQTVQAMKQGLYDANKSKLQAGFDQLVNMPLAREQDREYVQAKMTELATKINDYGSLDMSQQDLSNDLFNEIKVAAKDPFVISAIANTRKLQNYDAEVDEIKKKNPLLYKDLNYSFGKSQANYESYMKGESNNLGNLNYTPFTDISKEYKEIADNLDKYDKDIKRVAPQTDANGVVNGAYFIGREGKRLTETELKNKVNSLLTDGAKKQMSINGWGAYDQGATEQEKLSNVTQAFDRYTNGELERAEGSLAEVRLASKNNPSNEQYKEMVRNQETYISKLKTNAADIKSKGDKVAMYTMAYMGESVNNFASAFAYDTVDEIYSVNSEWGAARTHAFNVEQKNIDNEFKAKTLELQEKTFEAKYGAGSPSSGAVQTMANPDFAPKDEQGVFYDKQLENVEGLEAETESYTNKIYEGLEETVKKDIDKVVANSKGNVTRTEALLKLGLEGNAIISAAKLKQLDELALQTSREKQRLLTATAQVEKEAAESGISDSMAKSLYNNPNIKILWKGTDGKERLYPARDVLIGNDVMDDKGNMKRGLNNRLQVKQAIEKSMLADKYLSMYGNNQTVIDNNYIKKLASLLGENYEKILIPNQFREVSTRTGGARMSVEKLNPNSKTAQYLETHRKNKGYDSTYSTDSFDDIPEGNNYFKSTSPEEIRKKVGILLEKDETLGIAKKVVIKAGTEEFKDLAAKAGTEFKVDTGSSISITPIPGRPNEVSVHQLQEGVKEGSAVARPRTMTMRLEDLSPSILNRVDFNNKKQLITIKDLKPSYTPAKFGDINDRSRITDLSRTHLGGNDAIAEFTTQQGAQAFFFGTYPQKLGDIKNPTEMGKIVNAILADDTIEVGFAKGVHNDAYKQFVKKVGNDRKILWQEKKSFSDNDIQSAYNVIRYTPQLAVKDALEKILSGTDNETSMTIKILQQYYGSQ